MVNKQKGLTRFIPWILVVGGLVGLLSSIILTHDQIAVWQNPNFHPACNLNPVVSCGTVINSKQGHIFGIPAPFFGLITFSVLITVGVVLWAGTQFKRWFWLCLEAGAIGGVIFALWLFLLSIYRVHALCPFCLVTDVAVYVIAWYLTLHCIEKGFIRLPKQLTSISNFTRRHHLDLLVLWFLLLFLFILHHFWYYYGRYF